MPRFDRARRAGGGGHRAGGVPGRNQDARPLRPASSVRPWLHRIAVNRAIDFARSRALRGEVAPDALALAAAEADRADLSEEIVGALAALPPDHRAVVVLRHLLEYTPSEIAKLLEIPRGTVNSRLRRALDSLRPRLDEERA